MQNDDAQTAGGASGDVFLILSAAEAEALAGPTGAGAALAPVRLTDGVTFVLPLHVRADPAHQAVAHLLAPLPVAQVEVARFPALSAPPAG